MGSSNVLYSDVCYVHSIKSSYASDSKNNIKNNLKNQGHTAVIQSYCRRGTKLLFDHFCNFFSNIKICLKIHLNIDVLSKDELAYP